MGEAGLLGLVSAKDVGGQGFGLAEAAQVVECIAKACPSTAMVVTMHYCGTTVIEKLGNEATRRDIAAGRHLTTLAWSDTGSRSHFWAPVGTARLEGSDAVLDGSKTMVTAATAPHPCWPNHCAYLPQPCWAPTAAALTS
jgi:alkylation response protein AidB-like acyl-CoA dehydrogenase